jgi:hypothetical protein
MKIEFTEKEINTLLGLCESVEPCEDCDRDKICGVYNAGYCKAKNAENLAIKLNKAIVDISRGVKNL